MPTTYQDDDVPDEYYERLAETLTDYAEVFLQMAAEGNFYSAYENLYVAQNIMRVSRRTEPELLTAERLKLIEKLAWAMAELEHGYATRVPDDLEGVEALAKTVYEQEPVDN